jgi:hypothetical protein
LKLEAQEFIIKIVEDLEIEGGSKWSENILVDLKKLSLRLFYIW